jgi:hypothetical protein
MYPSEDFVAHSFMVLRNGAKKMMVMTVVKPLSMTMVRIAPSSPSMSDADG